MAKTRTVLITGAAVRVGRAMALHMAAKGWNIVLHYHSSQKDAQSVAALVEAKGRRAHLIRADLSDAKATTKIIPLLAGRGIQLDCLINNAAVFGSDRFEILEEKNWRSHMDINCFAPLLLMREFAGHYKGRDGNIVNLTDGLKGWSMSPEYLSYTLSKQSLSFATQMLARELAPVIRVNAIAPGMTVMSKEEKLSAASKARIRKNVLMKRPSSTQEICDALDYILSAPSLTGQEVRLAGGSKY